MDWVLSIIQTVALIAFGLAYFFAGKRHGYKSGYTDGYLKGMDEVIKNIKQIYHVEGDTNDNNL